MPRGLEWDWVPVVATVVAVAMAVLVTCAAAYAISASVRLCPRELAKFEAAHGGLIAAVLKAPGCEC